MAFDWLESVATGGASDWATSLSVASQLPGRIDGPADAYRHLLISAELHRKFNPIYADTLLGGHELDFGVSSNSEMDFHNNEIGRQIGQYVRSQNGSTQDVIDLIDSVMSNSLPGTSASSITWQQQGNLWVASGATATTLADGTSFAPIVLSEISPVTWQSSNPSIAGTRIPTANANWPDGSWQQGFDFNDVPAALGYLISSDIDYLVSTGMPPLDALLQILENNPDAFEDETFQFFVEQHIPRTAEAENQFYGSAYGTLAKAGRIDLIPVEHQCFGGEVPIDMWPLAPEFAPDPSNPNKTFDQDAVRAKVWKKPIELIRVGDIVVSFDDNDNLVPGPVTSTFQHDVKILLNFFGTRVTPGHVYYRADSERAQKFETLIDILRDDGVIQRQDGTLVRAATDVPVSDPLDGFVQAITGEVNDDGSLTPKERGRIRLGTRFVDGHKVFCIADLIAAGGGRIDEDELIHVDGDAPMPFHWHLGDTLPKPEDFVLACSGTTLEDIYKASEWEGQHPRMPAPLVMDGGPVQRLSQADLLVMPRNTPPHLDMEMLSGEVDRAQAQNPRGGSSTKTRSRSHSGSLERPH